MWEIAYVSDKGLVREENDDRVMADGVVVSSGKYFSTKEDNILVVLCDGVGGEKYGNEAAEIVAQSFQTLSAETLEAANIQKHIDCINEKVLVAQHKDAEHSQMATTVAGIAINGNDFVIFNVGDTRVYRYRRPYISQLSTDHSLAHENSVIGVDTNEGQKHVITRYLGGHRAIASIFDGKDSLGENDIFFLCSDGVWDVVCDTEIEKILSSAISTDEMRDRIMFAAKNNKSDDNISIAVIRRV